MPGPDRGARTGPPRDTSRAPCSRAAGRQDVARGAHEAAEAARGLGLVEGARERLAQLGLAERGAAAAHRQVQRVEVRMLGVALAQLGPELGQAVGRRRGDHHVEPVGGHGVGLAGRAASRGHHHLIEPAARDGRQAEVAVAREHEAAPGPRRLDAIRADARRAAASGPPASGCSPAPPRPAPRRARAGTTGRAAAGTSRTVRVVVVARRLCDAREQAPAHRPDRARTQDRVLHVARPHRAPLVKCRPFRTRSV